MPTWLLITILLLVGCGCTAYTTAHLYNKEHDSEWQGITYSGGSIEPKDFYFCKNCYHQANIKSHYCSNCGALMKNGKARIYYSDKIKLSE